MYNLSDAYVYAPSSMRRITMVQMHILLLPPSSYKFSFSYKSSVGAETNNPSTHAKTVATVDSSDCRYRCICLIIARDQRFMLCRVYRRAIARPGSHAAMTVCRTKGPRAAPSLCCCMQLVASLRIVVV